MRRIKRIIQGPTLAKPAPVNRWSGAIRNSYSLVDYISPITRTKAGSGVNVFSTVVLTIKSEHLDLNDVPCGVKSFNDFSHSEAKIQGQ